MRPFNPCFSLVFVVLYLLSCSAIGQVEAPTKKKKQAPVIAEINTAMQKFVDDGTISGAVTLVGHEGKVIHHGAVGLADIGKDREMKPYHLFAIASMTKPIVATSLMILQDEGKLNVDDKVSKYIPEFANVKLKDGESPKREITIRDCITHTSGLAGQQIFKGSLEDAVNKLATRPLAFEPGEKWQYSPGLNAAGRIVEIVSKQPLQDFMRDRIFEPLKMANTTFFPNEKQIRRVATLYGPSKEKTAAGKSELIEAEGFLGDLAKIEAPNPSGGLISNARDMFRFYQMVLKGGKLRREKIVSSDAVEQMTTPKTGDLKTGFTPGNCWGLGWCIVREPQGVTGMLSKGTYGHGGAFGTQGWVDPETQTVYVLMIQRTKMPNSDGSDVRKVFQQVASEQLN